MESAIKILTNWIHCVMILRLIRLLTVYLNLSWHPINWLVQRWPYWISFWLFSIFIFNMLEKDIDKKLRFALGKAWVAMIIYLCRDILSFLMKSPFLLAFVNYEKAFDSVCKALLWHILHRFHIPGKYGS